MPADACPRHPAAAVVAACAACGEPLCIGCAVPVRGRVLGPRCLEAELGDRALPDPPPIVPAAGPVRRNADLGLLAVLLTTALPWSGVGLGAGPFGAWGWDVRSASLVAIASLVGCAAAAAARSRGRRHGLAADRAAATAAAIALLAALAALLAPPPYTSVAVGPWAAVAAAAASAAAAATVLRRGAPSA